MYRFALSVLAAAMVPISAPPQKKAAPAPKKKAVPAPTPSPKTEAYPIVSLHVEGLKIYTEKQVLEVTGLKVGQPARKEDFEKGRDRLVEAGTFETVGYKF